MSDDWTFAPGDNRLFHAMEFQAGPVTFYATRNGATITLRVCNLSPHSERIISVPFLAEKISGRCSMATLAEFVQFLEGEVLEGLPQESKAEAQKSELRPALRAFAEIMEARLRLNDHKTAWQHELDPQILERLRRSLGKLERANHDAALLKQNGCQAEIVREAADVANFAMMLADRWRQPLRRMAEVDDRLPPVRSEDVLRQKESFAYEVPLEKPAPDPEDGGES